MLFKGVIALPLVSLRDVSWISETTVAEQELAPPAYMRGGPFQNINNNTKT